MLTNDFVVEHCSYVLVGAKRPIRARVRLAWLVVLANGSIRVKPKTVFFP